MPTSRLETLSMTCSAKHLKKFTTVRDVRSLADACASLFIDVNSFLNPVIIDGHDRAKLDKLLSMDHSMLQPLVSGKGGSYEPTAAAGLRPFYHKIVQTLDYKTDFYLLYLNGLQTPVNYGPTMFNRITSLYLSFWNLVAGGQLLLLEGCPQSFGMEAIAREFENDAVHVRGICCTPTCDTMADCFEPPMVRQMNRRVFFGKIAMHSDPAICPKEYTVASPGIRLCSSDLRRIRYLCNAVMCAYPRYRRTTHIKSAFIRFAEYSGPLKQPEGPSAALLRLTRYIKHGSKMRASLAYATLELCIKLLDSKNPRHEYAFYKLCAAVNGALELRYRINCGTDKVAKFYRQQFFEFPTSDVEEEDFVVPPPCSVSPDMPLIGMNTTPIYFERDVRAIDAAYGECLCTVALAQMGLSAMPVRASLRSSERELAAQLCENLLLKCPDEDAIVANENTSPELYEIFRGLLQQFVQPNNRQGLALETFFVFGLDPNSTVVGEWIEKPRSVRYYARHYEHVRLCREIISKIEKADEGGVNALSSAIKQLKW